MEININSINKVIGQSWKDFKKLSFDDATNEFVIEFIEEYYDRVKKGLLDSATSIEERTLYFKELLVIIKDYSDLDIIAHIQKCISSADFELSANVLINDVFKLQECCNFDS